MRVIFDVTNPMEREHTTTKRQDEGEAGEIKGLLTADGEFLRSAVQSGGAGSAGDGDDGGLIGGAERTRRGAPRLGNDDQSPA
jgi:hypothetical protein